MNAFHGTKNEETQKLKPTTTVPFLGRRPLKQASTRLLYAKKFILDQKWTVIPETLGTAIN